MEKLTRLSRFTTLNLGGVPLRYFRPREVRELREALAQCRRVQMPWRVLGGGSNILVEDGQLPYAVIHVADPGFQSIQRTGPHTVRAGAGVATARLLAFCRDEGLGGLEFLAGLPGTVGGAVAGNAGAWSRQISQPLRRLWKVAADGTASTVERHEVAFAYRSANLGPCVITGAEFELSPRDRQLIALQMKHYARARAQRHPGPAASAGCIFKNPPGESAGALLDRCGLKGSRVGGAVVSREHANFILNRGDATARDVLALIEKMKSAVRAEFGVELQLEVRHWPAEHRVA